jgi:hypothetical protein
MNNKAWFKALVRALEGCENMTVDEIRERVAGVRKRYTINPLLLVDALKGLAHQAQKVVDDRNSQNIPASSQEV